MSENPVLTINTGFVCQARELRGYRVFTSRLSCRVSPGTFGFRAPKKNTVSKSAGDRASGGRENAPLWKPAFSSRQRSWSLEQDSHNGATTVCVCDIMLVCCEHTCVRKSDTLTGCWRSVMLWRICFSNLEDKTLSRVSFWEFILNTKSD